jgi:hypothetical protein
MIHPFVHLSIKQLLAYITPSGGGLLPLSFGLFHQQESIRELTVDIFNELRAYPVSKFFIPPIPPPRLLELKFTNFIVA